MPELKIQISTSWPHGHQINQQLHLLPAGILTDPSPDDVLIKASWQSTALDLVGAATWGMECGGVSW
jgi:hypothetical protein